MQRWRVPLGFACAALFFLLSRPRLLTLAIGGAVAVMGLALRAWASGYLRKNDELATSGPYAHTRNPLYLGSFLIGLGFSIAAGRLYLGLLFSAGEELVYQTEFNKALLRGVDVAEFHFRVNADPAGSENGAARDAARLRLVADAVSKGFFAKLFRINIHEHIESTIANDIF